MQENIQYLTFYFLFRFSYSFYITNNILNGIKQGEESSVASISSTEGEFSTERSEQEVSTKAENFLHILFIS